ncbi:MAG: NAD(P)-binding protein [Pseudomonadota bacterium]
MTDSTITRRDFFNGAAVSVTAAGFAPGVLAQEPGAMDVPYQGTVYPPSLTGLRGNHPGSFDAAHSLAWQGGKPPSFQNTGEEYDLVVVGGGLSGLAAAALFQQQHREEQRILILDNHDDFGGHAKRNEFSSGGKTLFGVGGSINLEFPKDYSRVAKRLLRDIGVDLDRLEEANDPDYLLAGGFSNQSLFLKPQSGSAQMIRGEWFAAYFGRGDFDALIDQLPYAQDQKDRIRTLVSGEWDYLAGRSISERAQYMSSTSYHQFLREKVGLSEETMVLFDPTLRLGFGVGGEGLSVTEALESGAPGLRAVGWPWALADKALVDVEDPYDAMVFADGNASVARLLVRQMIPDVAEGSSMDDITLARFDYSKLDVEGAPVRLRLNSTAVEVKEVGDGVDIAYVHRSGDAKRVRARHAILACYNNIIPHLCPDMPQDQKEGLSYGSKVPFIWANVLLREAVPFQQTGTSKFICPNSYFHVVTKAPPVRLADYQTPVEPTDPMVVFMMRGAVPQKYEGQSVRDLYRQARYELLATPFSTFETEIRNQLTEMLGPHSFVADRDIEAITVNRWSHGYAYNYLQLDDPKFEKGAYPHEVGRQQFGRISIANTDSEARAYLDAAIDAAWRAVQEQTT